ncbi:MAG: hypothetical protein RR444_05920 [Oscillospiraceae bacterium]
MAVKIIENDLSDNAYEIASTAMSLNNDFKHVKWIETSLAYDTSSNTKATFIGSGYFKHRIPCSRNLNYNTQTIHVVWSYDLLNILKIDVSNISAIQVAQLIVASL